MPYDLPFDTTATINDRERLKKLLAEQQRLVKLRAAQSIVPTVPPSLETATAPTTASPRFTGESYWDVSGGLEEERRLQEFERSRRIEELGGGVVGQQREEAGPPGTRQLVAPSPAPAPVPGAFPITPPPASVEMPRDSWWQRLVGASSEDPVVGGYKRTRKEIDYQGISPDNLSALVGYTNIAEPPSPSAAPDFPFEEVIGEEHISVPVVQGDGSIVLSKRPISWVRDRAEERARGFTGDWQEDSVGETFGQVLQAGESLIAPSDIFVQTIMELIENVPSVIRGDFGEVDAPTLFTDGLTASLNAFRDRPVHQQIVLGILLDPAVIFKAVSISARIAKGVSAAAKSARMVPLIGLFRREIAHAHPGMSEADADAIANEIASKMLDEAINKIPAARRQETLPGLTEGGLQRGWDQFIRAAEDPGLYRQTLKEQAEQFRLLEEVGLTLDSTGNRFAARPRSITNVAKEVATHQSTGLGNLAWRAVGAVVGSSINKFTPLGKLTTAYHRQQRSANELVKVAMASAFDSHIDQWDALKAAKDRVLPVDANGMWVDPRTGKVITEYQNVLERPDNYARFITPQARRMIDDINLMTNYEVPRMLDDEGVVFWQRSRPADEYYVPHNVKAIREIDLSQEGLKSNYTLRRHYSTVTEGKAEGIKYGTNPREDIQLYMKWAYHQVVKKQFDDAVEEHGQTASQLVPQHLNDAATAAAQEVAGLTKRAKALAGAIRLEVGRFNTLARTGSQQASHAAQLDAELGRMQDLLDDMPMLGSIGEAPGRQALEEARKRVEEALRAEERAVSAVEKSRSALGEASGRAAAGQAELRRLNGAYRELVTAREEMVSASRVTTWAGFLGDGPPNLLEAELRQQDLAQRQYRTLGTQETRARRRVEAAEQRLEGWQSGLNVRRADLSDLADLVEEDLKLARQMRVDALSRLRAASSRAGAEQAQRGVIGERAKQMSAEIKKLQQRITRALRKEATTRDKEYAQGLVLEFLRAQQAALKGTPAARGVEAVKGAIREASEKAARTRQQRRDFIKNLEDNTVIPGALWGPNQPTDITIKQWRNRFFLPEDAKLLEEAMSPLEEGRAWTDKLIRVSVSLVNLKRSLAATGDAAEPFIQGLPVLASNPRAWSLQTARHYQAFFDPSVQSRRIRDNIEDYQWLARHGVPIGDLEFFAALETGEGVSFNTLFQNLPRGEEVQRYFRTAGKQSFGRFGAMYNTGLGEARVQLLQSTRQGWKGTDAQLAQHIRNLTGGLDSRALGVGPGRAAAEGFWIAFSPRLLRSTIALVGDALQGGLPLEVIPKVVDPVSPRLGRAIRKGLGGVEADPVYSVDVDLGRGVRQVVEREIVGGYASTAHGRRSLKTLATLAGGVTTTYILTGMALGKDWDEIKEGLNPLNGKRFLSHQINGDWIGVGGQIRALFQMMGSLALDPSSLTETTRRDNPILAFLSGRGAIGTQAVLQAGEAGVALVGGEVDLDPFERVDGFRDFARVQGIGSLPFVGQAILEGQKPLTVGASAIGLRTSEWNEYDGMRDNKGARTAQVQHFLHTFDIVPGEAVQMEWEGETLEFDMSQDIVEFRDLQPREQKLFRDYYPNTFAREEELLRALAKRRNAPQWSKDRVKALEDEDDAVAAQQISDDKMKAGTLGVEQWKKEYRERTLVLMGQRQILYADEDGEEGAIRSPLDVYYAQIEKVLMMKLPLTGAEVLMTDEKWEELESWMSQQPGWFQKYVDDNTGLSAPTEETQDFKEAKTLLRNEYWGVPILAVEAMANIDTAVYRQSPEDYQNIHIWSERGTEFFDVTPVEARVYLEGQALTDRLRTDWMTVLRGEEGTQTGEIKKKKREMYNHVSRQVSLLKRQTMEDNPDVKRALYRYYAQGASKEARFLQSQEIVGAAP